MPHSRSSSISIRPSSPPTSPATSLRQSFQKKQKMSVAQAYFLAHTARSKLSKEASKADHDLRVLVGHANLLDGLMLDLAEAEREQENWFNQTLSKAASTTSLSSQDSSKKVQWADSLPAVEEDSDSDSEDSISDDEDVLTLAPPPVPARSRARTPPPAITISTSETHMDFEMDDIDSDDEIDAEELQLVRTVSHSPTPPPELLHESDDSEDDSEDEGSHMPPSPEDSIAFDMLNAGHPAATQKQTQQQHQQKEAQLSTSPEDALHLNGFFMPSARPQSIEAY